MHLRLTMRRSALSAVAVALIAVASLLVANVVHAAPNRAAREALLSALAQAATARVTPSAARVLPAPTGEGRPFRQTMVGNCSFDSPSPNISGTFCRFPGIAVATNRLLKIETISCLMVPPLGLILLATSGKVAKLFSSIIGAGFLEGSFTLGGPFYVPPGEKIFIWGLSDPGASASCTVYGLLSPID